MRVSEIILNEAPSSGITKWVRSDMQPKYSGGAYFDSEESFNTAIMKGSGFLYKAALKSPQHPVTGKPALKFPGVDDPSHPMADKRKQDPNFNTKLVAALGAPSTQAVATTTPKTILDPNRAKLSTADISKTQPTSVASREQPPEQASTERPPAPKNVRKMPLHPATKKAWIRQYGKTHNPDGTPK